PLKSGRNGLLARFSVQQAVDARANALAQVLLEHLPGRAESRTTVQVNNSSQVPRGARAGLIGGPGAARTFQWRSGTRSHGSLSASSRGFGCDIAEVFLLGGPGRPEVLAEKPAFGRLEPVGCAGDHAIDPESAIRAGSRPQ